MTDKFHVTQFSYYTYLPFLFWFKSARCIIKSTKRYDRIKISCLKLKCFFVITADFVHAFLFIIIIILSRSSAYNKV